MNNKINTENNFLNINYMNTTFKFATGRKIKAYRKNNKINPLITKRIKESIENNYELPENLSEFLKENQKVFNRRTGRLVNKKTYFKQNNQLRKKYKDTLTLYKDFIISTNEETQLSLNFQQFLQDTQEQEGDFVINKNMFINGKSIIDVLKKEISNELLLIKINNKFFSLNDKTIIRLNNIFEGVNEEQVAGSDADVKNYLENANEITFTRIHKTKKDGAFFPYLMKYKVNLKKYGIFNQFNKNNYDENCFIRALRESKIIDQEIINKIIDERYIKCRSIPKCKLNELSKKLNINISLSCGYTTESKTGKKSNKLVKYPTKNRNKKNPTLHLGLLEKHYFLNDKTEYTLDFFKNIDEYINKDPKFKCLKFEGKSIRIRKKETVKSYKLIQYLLTKKDKFFKPIKYENKLLNTNFYDKFEDFKKLSFNNNDWKEIKYKEPKYSLNGVPTYFCDFETYAQEKSLKHIPYMVCSRKYEDYNKNEYLLEKKNWHDIKGNCFYGINCGSKMLDMMILESKKHFENKKIHKNYKKILILFHNLKYDWIFMKRIKGLRIVSRIKPNGKTILVNCFYKGVPFIIRDTLCMIPAPLRKFKNMFDLETEKEIMPYSIFNKTNIENKFIDIKLIKSCKEFIKTIKSCSKNGIKYKYVFDGELWKQFLDNCNKWGCIINNKVNIVKYSKIYCLLDCKVLNDGYFKFRYMIHDITGLDCIDILTISSVADQYLIKEGCYEDCVYLSGVVREYIQKCLVGGRTMTRDNKPNLKLNCDIVDYDACSLYPSAMYRMKGFVKGLPKIIKDFNSVLKNNSHYYVRVKITKINKKRHMPCISYLDKKGTRQFSNDMIGKIIYLDKTGLEDFVEFMGGEYEFIDGYYFNNGYNTKIKKCIKHLYDSRLKYKKQKNPIQGVIKLIMNSSYGKTCLKSYEDQEIIKNNRQEIEKENLEYYEKNFKNFIFKEKGIYYVRDGDIFIRNNYNSIKEVEIVDNTYFIKQYYITGTHFNRIHLGVQILSMSKRIMNEVVYTGEDNNIDLYYMDTDSLHLDRNKVKLLEDKFLEKYKREVRGTYMGNFHTDLEMHGIDGDKIRSINSIFLTKKMYINQLEGIDNNGKKHYDFHIRMKGVPTKSVYHYGKYHKIENPINIYKNIYDGEHLTFDLGCGGNNTLFEFDKDNDVRFKLDFTRVIKLNQE